MAFRVGQKVVCVDDRPGLLTGKRELRRGEIYTITGFDTEDKRLEHPGLYLAETPEKFHPNWRFPVGWAPERFRPVVERKTSIEIFQRMLSPTKEPTHV